MLASVVNLGDESTWRLRQCLKEIYICWGTGKLYCNALGAADAARLPTTPGVVNCARKASGSRDTVDILLTSLWMHVYQVRRSDQRRSIVVEERGSHVGRGVGDV